MVRTCPLRIQKLNFLTLKTNPLPDKFESPQIVSLPQKKETVQRPHTQLSRATLQLKDLTFIPRDSYYPTASTNMLLPQKLPNLYQAQGKKIPEN